MSIPAQGTSDPRSSRHPVRAVHVVLAACRSGRPPVTLRTGGRGAIGPQAEYRHEIRAGLSYQGMRPASPARGMPIALRRDTASSRAPPELETLSLFLVLVNPESDTRTGVLVEYGTTQQIFGYPEDSRTRAYVTGRVS